MKKPDRKNTFKFLSLAGVMTLTACSSAVDSQGYTYDPWEGFNRGVFAVNETLDKALLKPVAQGYEYTVPSPVRTGVGNFFGNLGDITSLGNAVLQLDGQASAGIAARVINNTVFGIGGIFDVATPMGNPKISKDFGSTLARYGVQSGPFVMLPVLGPSTLRDGIGKVPDTFMNPITYIDDDTVRWSMLGVDTINTRASLLPVERQMEGTVTDKYAAVRDNWLQYRWGQLGTPVSAAQQDDIDALFATPPNEQTQ